MNQVFLTQPLPGKDVRLSKPYDRGPRNYILKEGDEEYQVIRISEGCPNQCPYCAEPAEIKWFGVPEITRNQVKILDMNILSKPQAVDAIKDLGSRRVNGKVVYYEFVCGVDYRFLTQKIADLLHENRFINIRIAWDWGFGLQMKIKDAVELLETAGYASKDIGVFIVTNWRIPYTECERKRKLCAVWNVQVLDCVFDNQSGKPNPIPIFWAAEEMRSFRHEVRKQNQMVNFGIDPEEPKQDRYAVSHTSRDGGVTEKT